MEETIDELLVLARNARGASSTLLALDALLGEMDHEWRARFAHDGRELRVRCDPDAPPSSASAAAVRQVLRVLLDNAARHGLGTVTVTVRESTGAVAIDVVDQGPGLHTPDWELFARRAESTHGHGLGLSLARRLAEAEGGRLHLARPVPPTFTLLLPARPAPEHEQLEATSVGSSG